MANVNILGALGVSDSDYVKLHTFGQGVVYDALGQILGDHNEDMASVEALFVDATTFNHTDNYKLPGTGRLQVMGSRSRAAEVKASGSWDTAYPLEQFGASLGIDRIRWAYLTAKEFDRHVMTVQNQDRNTRRYNVLRALFNNTVRTFVDENWGSLSIQPLAIGATDGILYPPVVGSEVNSTRQSYLGVSADSTTITDANNPIPTIVNTLEASFGTPTGGSDIVIFCNNAQTAGLQGLAGFDTIPNRFVSYGDNVSLVESAGLPISTGRVLGESDSALLVEWRWIPSGYLLAIHMGAPKPLMRRVDPPDTGLSTGLQMVPTDPDHPFLNYEWSNRYGFGVGNRLNGVIMDLATGSSTYTIPTQYA